MAVAKARALIITLSTGEAGGVRTLMEGDIIYQNSSITALNGSDPPLPTYAALRIGLPFKVLATRVPKNKVGNNSLVAAIHAKEQGGQLVLNEIERLHGRPAKQVINWLKSGLLRWANQKKPNTGCFSRGAIPQRLSKNWTFVYI